MTVTPVSAKIWPKDTPACSSVLPHQKSEALKIGRTQRRAKRTYSFRQLMSDDVKVERWMRAPGRYDVAGIDTRRTDAKRSRERGGPTQGLNGYRSCESWKTSKSGYQFYEKYLKEK